MKRFSGLLQFILGFFLGITILVGLTSALGYLMFSRLAATPNKPVFSEENKSKPKATTSDKKSSEKIEINTEEIINPYLGKNHPEFKSGMLHCGEVKDSIKAK